MATVLMAWELGSGMGHLDRMRLIGDALRDRGHRVVFALRDLARAHARIASEGYEVLQAPVWLPTLRHPPHLARYTAVLAAAGWMDDGGLAGLVQAWQGLIRAVGPQALLADHAPTALLASRGWPLARFAFGHAFELPPVADGRFPLLAWWTPEVPGSGLGSGSVPEDEPALLAATRRGLALAGAPPLESLTSLFDGVQRGLLSLPEISHYPDLPGSAPMLGPMYAGQAGQAPDWPDAPGPRVFAYLDPGSDALLATLSALRDLGWPAIVHATGVDPAAASRVAGPTVRVEPLPLALDDTLRTAALVVSHGSIGTVTAAALAGVPQLVMPRHIEQTMVSRRVADGGLGLMLTGVDGTPAAAATLAGAMRQVVASPACAAQAREVALRHRHADPRQAAARAAELVDRALVAPTAQPTARPPARPT